jgi:hypothetical protein
VLPVEAQMTALAPASTAFEMAMVIPRSLKDPVGFIPSYLTQTLAPVRAESAAAGISGVPPSPSVMTGVASVMFSRSAYSFNTPRHWRDGVDTDGRWLVSRGLVIRLLQLSKRMRQW